MLRCGVGVVLALIFIGGTSPPRESPPFAQSQESMEREVGRGLVYVLTTTESAFAKPDAMSANEEGVRRNSSRSHRHMDLRRCRIHVCAGEGFNDKENRTMTRRRLLLCGLFLLIAASARATEYVDIGLHGRVQASDIVVVARVVDPALALVTVERVLKGDAPKRITLVAYVDGFSVPAQQKPLV